jgi:hypothetical protein
MKCSNVIPPKARFAFSCSDLIGVFQNSYGRRFLSGRIRNNPTETPKSGLTDHCFRRKNDAWLLNGTLIWFRAGFIKGTLTFKSNLPTESIKILAPWQVNTPWAFILGPLGFSN